MGVFFVDVN